MKQDGLRFKFYKNLLVFVVIPIITVGVILLLVLRGMFVNLAREKVAQAQGQLLSTMQSEISNASLRLAHLALVNENESIELATLLNREQSPQMRYVYSRRMMALLNSMVVPQNNVVAVHYFYKTGQVYCYKDDLRDSQVQTRNLSIYKTALASPGVTYVGAITHKQTYSSGNPYIIGIFYAPGWVGSQNDVEMLCFYIKTEVPDMMKSFSSDKKLGKMLVTDADGNIMIGYEDGMEGKNISEIPPLEGVLAGKEPAVSGRAFEGQMAVITKQMDDTGWYVINLVDYAVLLEDFNRVTMTTALVILVLFILYTAYSMLFLRDIINPICTLTTAMLSVEQGDLTLAVKPSHVHELAQLASTFNHMVKRIHVLIAEGQQREQDKMRAELNALQSQINPHFLSNALNSIRFTAMLSKFESVQKMAEALIKILTASFNRGGSGSTVKEEIEVLDSYVYLMKIRYSDRFEISYDIPPDLQNCSMPKLTLQPIVENAIVHAFEETDKLGHIGISARKVEDMLVFTVQDDGKGMAEETIREVLNLKEKTASIGISNVDGRIKLNYGNEYGIAIKSVPGEYTQVIVRLPMIVQEMSERETMSNRGEGDV